MSAGPGTASLASRRKQARSKATSPMATKAGIVQRDSRAFVRHFDLYTGMVDYSLTKLRLGTSRVKAGVVAAAGLE